MAQLVAKLLDNIQLSDTGILMEAEGESLSEAWKRVAKIGHTHPEYSTGGGGTGGGIAAFVGQWLFMRQNPLPSGYLELNGELHAEAGRKLPDLVSYLITHPDECTTEADWQARSAAASGTGGVPFYVLDSSADTLRMPDTRGDSPYHATPGTWQGDAMRDIKGTIVNKGAAIIGFFQNSTSTGALYLESLPGSQYGTGNTAGIFPNMKTLGLNASLVVPTDTTTHPRRVALTWAVYAGTTGA